MNLVRTKAPLVESHTTGRDAVDLFHLGREVRRGIEAGVFIPNRGCWMCRDCEYEQDCRDWTGNDDRRELRT